LALPGLKAKVVSLAFIWPLGQNFDQLNLGQSFGDILALSLGLGLSLICRFNFWSWH